MFSKRVSMDRGHRSSVAITVAAVFLLALLTGCGGGGGGGTPLQSSSVPLSLRFPPVTTDPSQPRWFYIVSGSTLAGNSPMVLNVQDASLASANTILWPLQNNAKNELWQFAAPGGGTASGNFVSNLGDYPYNPYNPAAQLMMSQANSASGPVPVVTYPGQSGSPEGGGATFQLWNVTANSRIVNNQANMYLYVPSITQGAQATLGARPGNPGNNYQWLYWPSRTLQPILDQPDQPYPAFTGAEAPAYTNLNSALGLSGTSCTLDDQPASGVRCEYKIIDQSLDGYLTYISENLNHPPSGVSKSAWNAVLLQIQSEITDVQSVRDLFDQFNTFYDALFINNEALLDQMISDAEITDQSTMVSYRTLTILEGVITSALYSVEDVASAGLAIGVGAIANLGETAISAAVTKGTLSENSFQIAVSDLWGALSTDFNAVLTENGNNETTILEDWGRVQATEALIASTQPDSLAWSPQTTPELVAALEPAFKVEVMKSLMPAKYSTVQANPQVPTGSFAAGHGAPAYDGFVEGLGYGVWNQFYLGNIGDTSEFPSQQAMQNDIFGNGVQPIQFFNSLNGWKFNSAYSDNDLTWFAVGASGCNSLLVSITNDTPDTVTLNAGVAKHDGGLFGDTPRSLGPYATNIFGVQSVGGFHGPDFDFSVSGPNGSASFSVQQNYCLTQAGDITYAVESTSGQYQLDNLGTTTGSEANDRPGIQRVAVYNPGASQ